MLTCAVYITTALFGQYSTINKEDSKCKEVERN